MASSYVPPAFNTTKPEARSSLSPFYSPPTATLGRFFFAAVVLSCMVTPFVFDFNETHVYNPRWPPHAKFHNGQTMSMGIGLGLATLFLAFRPALSPRNDPATLSEDVLKASAEYQLDLEERDALAAALVASLYWATALSAPLYPGAAGMDPEFGEGFPQLVPFLANFVASWLGWWFEATRISNQRLLLASKTAKWD